MDTAEIRLLALLAQCGEQPTQTPHARFSTAGGCLRAHVYDRRLLAAGDWPRVTAKPVRWRFAAEVGTALGNVIEGVARGMGAGTQLPAQLGAVHGNLDIEWPDLDAVWDLKWAGEYAWKAAQKAPDAKHVAQVNAYAVARGRARWALVYLRLSALGKGEGVEYVLHEGEADAAQADREVTQRWAAVEQHLAGGTLPDREVDEPTCRRLRCLHIQECYR